MKKLLLLLAACLAFGCGSRDEEIPHHMFSPPGAEEPKKPTERVLSEWGFTDEQGTPIDITPNKSAFTLPDGFGFGVFPANGVGDPNAIPDGTCTSAFVHEPVHNVNRCNIPKYKNWTYRVTSTTSTQTGYIRDAVDAVNELALYGSSGTVPLAYTTSTSARVKIEIVPYTPEYTREKFVKVRISDSYLASSQFGPIRRYGRCTVSINENEIEQAPFAGDPSNYRNMIHALAMKGAWQCLGRGTDYYALNWRCQAHHMTGISPPETCGETGLTNADMDHVEPFFDETLPRSSSSMPGWASWGDKVSLEFLWLSFDPN